ncbi:MAG: DegT/DnrJ/EryC1/StrS family aminotransferase [Acidimicrobiales bacterium]
MIDPSANPAQAAGSPRIGLARPDVGDAEVAAVTDALLSGVLTNGPRTAAFESAFAGRHCASHAVAFASGTVALTAMYLAASIGPGDEVIVPSLTFVSSATSVLHVGARPVFADVDPETFNLDPKDVARRMSPRTKAILAVHYGGQPADMDELLDLAHDTGVLLFEDAAEAHGANYRGRPVGGLGHAAMFSFTPTKNITTGEGGMVTTQDAAFAARLSLLRNHGQTAPYEHALLGYNWRMTELQAAMGLVQLSKLDAILARKDANAAHLASSLATIPGVRPPLTRPDRSHVHMLYTVVVDQERDRVLHGLADAGIEARVYFPPAHSQPIFAPCNAHLPVTEGLSGRILSLPFHSMLSEHDLDYIAMTLADLVGSSTRSPR